MRLASLLTEIPEMELTRLGVEHLPSDSRLAGAALRNWLEAELPTYSFISKFIARRQPPTFAILEALLDAPGYELPVEGFQAHVTAQTDRLTTLVTNGEILARANGLRLYRKMLFEARRNDLDIDASEASLLAVFRREENITLVEHFLLEHHRELRDLWERDDAFVHEMTALRSSGIVFLLNDALLLAEDAVPAIRATLGIVMASTDTRRLFASLNSSVLADALTQIDAKTSGSKEDRIERLIVARVQPRAVLPLAGLAELRDLARDAGAAISGSKDELVDRLVPHFARNKDLMAEEVPTPRLPEPRRLDEERFRLLFRALKGRELTDITRGLPELRQSGTKDQRIDTLWDAELAERTLLGSFRSRDLEEILLRLGLKTSGSKFERVDRLTDYFAAADAAALPALDPDAATSPTESIPIDPTVAKAQESFRQRSSNPQALLQPWLEDLLAAPGRVRCYATEVPNPTQQLKNKLSQAAAARGGMLVLLLADADARDRAREALIERWGSNEEWPKSVACVGLAAPLGEPVLTDIVVWDESPYPERIRQLLFPAVRVATAKRPPTSEDRSTP